MGLPFKNAGKPDKQASNHIAPKAHLNDKPCGNDVSGGDAIDFSTLQLLEETAHDGR